MMPPIRSHRNAAWHKFFMIGENAKTTSQPMLIYSVEDNQCGQVIQQILNMVPTIATIHTVVRRGMPMAFGKTIRQIGV